MKIPFLSNIKNSQEAFLGLFLKEHEGIVLLMIKSQGLIQIKEKINFKYTNGWENLTENVDEVLYQIEQKHHTQISKTIFFIYSHLVDDNTGDIKKPYLSKIKEMVKNLELEAMGYIECYEAVSFYLEKKEEASLTAILMELDKKQMSFFIYKGGKITYKNNLARTDNIVEDFISAVEGLKEKKLLLPSRIIIYDSDSIDDAAAKIIGYKWTGDYFVQIPKITILKENEVIEGLIQVFSEQTKTKEVVTDKSFGFVIGEDIKNTEEQEFKQEKKIEKSKVDFNFINKLPKFTFPKVNMSFLKGKTALFIGIFIIILSLFLNEYFFHKANLTIYLPSQTIKKEIDQSVDYKVASISADFSETVATTGKKEIGEKAKGTVTIHNFDDQEKVFSKGTLIEASGIKFILDNEIKVASATLAADGSAKLPGKSNITVISQNIGPEGNLSKGTRFKVADLPTTTYFAINESALAGGTKKEIRTISLSDINNLEKTILDKAKKSSKIPDLSKEEAAISNLSETDFLSEKFSKEVGEEGDKVTLTAKTKTTYYVYNKSLLSDLLLKELKAEIKSGYLVEKKNLAYRITESEINKKKIDLKIDVTAKAIPEVNQNEITKKVVGKNQAQLETILKSNFKIEGYDIVIDEPISPLKKYLPIFYKNISLNISSL